MGKASRWFRGLLGLKIVRHPNQKPPPRNKWSSVKAHKDENRQKSRNDVVPGREHDDDASKHATAVAAVVQLTSSGRNISLAGRGGNVNTPTARVTLSRVGNQSREERAAVMIQSHFRAYLSRRALRALKALVKLQALARGYLVRRQTAHALRRLQALVRAQVRARAGRLLVSESPQSSMKTSQFNHPGPVTPEKFEHVLPARSMKQDQLMMLKRNGSKSGGSVRYDPVTRVNCIWMDSRKGERLWEQGAFTRSLPTNGGQSDEILEVDSGNPRASSRRRSLFYSSHLCQGSDQNCQSFSTSKDSTARQSVLSPSSSEVQFFSPLGIAQDDDESAFCAAANSPAFYSASSGGGSLKRVTFTPIKSDGSHSCLSGYSDCPNYMANTKSSKAKVRSLSAPKQRPQFERSNSSKRYSVHANFTNKAYPGSGRLDTLGLPIRGDVAGFSGGHWHRY